MGVQTRTFTSKTPLPAATLTLTLGSIVSCIVGLTGTHLYVGDDGISQQRAKTRNETRHVKTVSLSVKHESNPMPSQVHKLWALSTKGLGSDLYLPALRLLELSLCAFTFFPQPDLQSTTPRGTLCYKQAHISSLGEVEKLPLQQ